MKNSIATLKQPIIYLKKPFTILALSSSILAACGSSDGEALTLDDPDNLSGESSIEVTSESSESVVTETAQSTETTSSEDSTETTVNEKNSLKVEDIVVDIDSDTETLTTRLGVDIDVSDSTVLEVSDSEGFSFDDFRVGDAIEVEGYINDDGNLVWGELSREDGGGEHCELQGFVNMESIDPPQFEILGVTIDTTGTEEDDFENAEDETTSASTFFSSLTAEAIISVRSDDAAGCTNGFLMTMDGEVAVETENVVSASVSVTADSDNPNVSETQVVTSDDGVAISQASASVSTSEEEFDNEIDELFSDDIIIDSSVGESSASVSISVTADGDTPNVSETREVISEDGSAFARTSVSVSTSD